MFSFQKSATCMIAAFIVAGLALAPPATAAKSHGTKSNGSFYLVGLGCGDPDNITVKAMKIIRASDIVFADSDEKAAYPELLAGKKIYPRPSLNIHKYFQSVKIGFARGSAVKKRDISKASIQAELDRFVRTVTDAVKDGKTVTLLDYGDPCIYGPYIWVMNALEALNPKIVPGVSSLNAANAALKQGLTFGYAAHSAILTNAADLREGYNGMDTIERMAATRSSMVVFTMYTKMAPLVEALGRYYPDDTPIAVVINAGYEGKERVLRGTLASIVGIVKKEGGLPFAHLIYVGDFLNS
jgi:precorrin-4/cobalt-precorrin-4 C11-methyltransferase